MKKLGVIVGRFQVDVPTLGHNYLINYMKERSDYSLILLGSREEIDIRNILSPQMRYDILKQIHHECIIKPIYDIDNDDTAWSNRLDDLIMDTLKIQLNESLDTCEVYLYGSRDSFSDYYNGIFKDNYIDVDVPDEYKDMSATKERERIASTTINDPNFRAGVIHGVYNYIKQLELMEERLKENTLNSK